MGGDPLVDALGLFPSRPGLASGLVHGCDALLARRGSEGRPWLRLKGCWLGPVIFAAHPQLTLRSAVRSRQDGTCLAERSSDLLLGDPRFDGRVRACGNPALVRATATVENRRALERLLDAGVLSVRLARAALTLWARPRWTPDEVGLALEALSVLVLGSSRVTGEGREWVVDERLLAVALTDPEVRVRAAAAELLLDRVKDGDEFHVRRVCQTLAASAAVRTRLRLDALWAMEHWAPRDCTRSLRNLLRVEDPTVRCAVIDRLGEIRDAASARALALLGHHQDERVAARAIEALGRLRSGDPVPMLLERAFGGPAPVRRAAVGALGCLGQAPHVARALRRLASARSEDRELRILAQAALREVEGRLPGSGSLAVALPDEGAVSLISEDSGLDEPSADRYGLLFEAWI